MDFQMNRDYDLWEERNHDKKGVRNVSRICAQVLSYMVYQLKLQNEATGGVKRSNGNCTKIIPTSKSRKQSSLTLSVTEEYR